MGLPLESLGILIRVAAQVLAFSALFVLVGRWLLPALIRPAAQPKSQAFEQGAGFFLGLSAFQVLFVFGSLVAHGAKRGMWIALGALAAVVLKGLRDRTYRPRRPFRTMVVWAGLLSAFAAVCGTVWLEPVKGQENMDMFTCLGTVHAGRYANYALDIATQDRIPHLAQNMGQSMMAACTLLLGIPAPLAALMAWLLAYLTALTLLIFGLFEMHGLGRVRSFWGTYLVLACNGALSLACKFILDNGYPLGLVGYPDTVASLGTFALVAIYLRDAIALEHALPKTSLLVPALGAMVWSWSAPQNVLVVPVVGLALLVVTIRDQGKAWLHASRLVPSMFVFFGALAAGASQLGAFLPQRFRENGSFTVKVDGHFAIHPYVTYIAEPWQDARLVGFFLPPKYAATYDAGKARGLLTGIMRVIDAFEGQLWESIRIYGFLFLGVFLLYRSVRAEGASSPGRGQRKAWLVVAAAALFAGYGVVFFLEMDSGKWWITRFLLPAALSCFMALVISFAPERRPNTVSSVAAFVAVVLFGTIGPVVDFSGKFGRTWFGDDDVPLAHRLDLLAVSKGPWGALHR